MILDGTDAGPRDGRLFLRPLTVDEVSDDYVGWLNDPEVSRYLLGDRRDHTMASTRDFVEAANESADAALLGIHLSTAPTRHVGNVKFSSIRTAHGTAEIGILIGDRSQWGRGLATEALLMSRVLAEKRLLLRKLTAGCLRSNIGSIRAFEKAGFERVGLRRGQFLLAGVPEDEILLECHLT